MAGLGRGVGVRLGLEQSGPVLDEDLDHDVGELDVHDGGHRLLLGPEEGGTEADGQVGHRHQVLVALDHHLGQVRQQHLQHPVVGGGQLLDQSVDLMKNIYTTIYRLFVIYLAQSDTVILTFASLYKLGVQGEG